MRMASANLQCIAEFARSLELNALNLSHLTFITTTIRTFHICWIALLSRVNQEYFLLSSKSTLRNRIAKPGEITFCDFRYFVISQAPTKSPPDKIANTGAMAPRTQVAGCNLHTVAAVIKDSVQSHNF